MSRIDAMDTTLRLASALRRRPVEAHDRVIRLTARATLAARLPAGACVAVQSGRIWLTQAGDANDYFIEGGERHVVTHGGRVVIESFTPQAVLRVLAEASIARPGFP